MSDVPTFPNCMVTREAFQTMVQPLIGLSISRPCKGYGSAVFLELGQLTSRPSVRTIHVSGEASISIYWDWRIEADKQILFGSSNSGPEIVDGIQDLLGETIEQIQVAGTIPEIEVHISNGYRLRSMAMVTGHPDWNIKLPGNIRLYPEAGTIWQGERIRSLTPERSKIFAHAEKTAKRWGIPAAGPFLGQCRACQWYRRIDGEAYLLDYGVCTSSDSPLDGKVVYCQGGCAHYLAEAED